MIEKMQRISILLFHTEKKRILRGLQVVGVVDLNLAPAETERVRKLEHDLSDVKNILNEIQAARTALAPNAVLPEVLFPNETTAQQRLVKAMLEKKSRLVNALHEVREMYERYRAWGEIPIDKIAQLQQRRVTVHLFSGSPRYFDQYDFSRYDIFEVQRDENTVRFALVSSQKEAPVIPFQHFPVPARSTSDMRYEISLLSEHIEVVNREIAGLEKYIPRLLVSSYRLETKRLFEVAKLNLRHDKSGLIFHITGYFPEAKKARLLHFLEEHSLAYEIAEPDVGENVPVRLRNRGVVKLFEKITNIFALPAYREMDPTPFFAPFFTLFFGFCMGDVGYGMLLLIVAFVLMRKKSLRDIGGLIAILAAATILSGVLMNSFFGANLFVRDGSGIFRMQNDPAVFAAYTVKGKTVFPAMTLSLLIGMVQILVAFVLQSFNEIIYQGKRYALKAAGMLSLVAGALILAAHKDFLALGLNQKLVVGPIQLGKFLTAPPLYIADGLLALGGVCFFFFGNPDRRFILRPLAALWDFYGFATGLLGDFLSYIRLFALALAGGLLGNSFNQIAFMLLPKTGDDIQYASFMLIPALFVLVVGHALNFLLGALGAFVHPLRLTFVEFYKNINFRGGGRAYKPFRRASSVV